MKNAFCSLLVTFLSLLPAVAFGYINASFQTQPTLAKLAMDGEEASGLFNRLNVIPRALPDGSLQKNFSVVYVGQKFMDISCKYSASPTCEVVIYQNSLVGLETHIEYGRASMTLSDSDWFKSAILPFLGRLPFPKYQRVQTRACFYTSEDHSLQMWVDRNNETGIYGFKSSFILPVAGSQDECGD